MTVALGDRLIGAQSPASQAGKAGSARKRSASWLAFSALVV